MKIGIDAKWYFNGHPSGKVVVENLVNYLIEINKLDEYYIYLDKRDKNLSFPYTNKNVNLIYVPNWVNAFTNFFILPFYTFRNKLDVCMYQNYSPFWGAKKRVNYVHDALFMDYPEFFSTKERIYFWPMKYLSRTAHHVITISKSEKERMIKHGFSKKENISFVYHGIGLAKNDSDSFKDENRLKQYQLPENFILYLGRLNVRKNIQTLLKAMPKINKDTSLVIVGKDDHKTIDLDGQINKLNLSQRIVRLGFVSSKDIASIYKKANVFCFPSFAEGFGLPPLEAMHYGTPTVVSNTTSLPEICNDASLYVDPNKEDEIATQVNKLLDDKRLREDIIKKGKQRASLFSWEKAAKEILTIIKSI